MPTQTEIIAGEWTWAVERALRELRAGHERALTNARSPDGGILDDAHFVKFRAAISTLETLRTIGALPLEERSVGVCRFAKCYWCDAEWISNQPPTELEFCSEECTPKANA